jgi:CHAD domain-containing protein
MKTDDSVIDLPVEEGARIVSIALLAACDEAARRLEAGQDDEALHDFRVALRRLRTALRSFRPSLRSSISRSKERRLRDIARSTSGLRDAEVQLSWLRAQRDALRPGHGQAADLLSRRLAAQGARGDEGRRAAERYRSIAGGMARRLHTYEGTIGGAHRDVPFGAALAAAVVHELARLRRRLAAIQGPADGGNIHRARIAGKRVRYLLEILQGTRYTAAGENVKQLKGLQDILGEIHDSHVVAATIADALVDAATQQALRIHAAVQGPPPPPSSLPEGGGSRTSDEARTNPRAGLLELDRLTRDQRDALFARLEAQWRGGGAEAFAARVQEITSSLEARAGGRLERERAYLLSAAPATADSPMVDVVQGWLPGERLVEHLRRERAAGGERYWRALDAWRAGRRLALCEETTREVFEGLWPLTQGRRVELRRTMVEEGTRVWRIDEFADRPLVVARITLSPAEGTPDVPEWLRPLVVLEITEDPDYSDEALASRPGVPAVKQPPPPEAASS